MATVPTAPATSPRRGDAGGSRQRPPCAARGLDLMGQRHCCSSCTCGSWAGPHRRPTLLQLRHVRLVGWTSWDSDIAAAPACAARGLDLIRDRHRCSSAMCGSWAGPHRRPTLLQLRHVRLVGWSSSRNCIVQLLHVAPRRRGGLLWRASVPARMQVRRVPVPPVVLGMALFVGVVMFGGFVQQVRQCRYVHGWRVSA